MRWFRDRLGLEEKKLHRLEKDSYDLLTAEQKKLFLGGGINFPSYLTGNVLLT
jgi:hypothetical protein